MLWSRTSSRLYACVCTCVCVCVLAVFYRASDIGGPLMRDVKNFICRRLDLGALVEDEFGMELLVAGNIISLGLPVEGVYKQVRRHNMCLQCAFSVCKHNGVLNFSVLSTIVPAQHVLSVYVVTEMLCLGLPVDGMYAGHACTVLMYLTCICVCVRVCTGVAAIYRHGHQQASALCSCHGGIGLRSPATHSGYIPVVRSGRRGNGNRCQDPDWGRRPTETGVGQ